MPTRKRATRASASGERAATKAQPTIHTAVRLAGVTYGPGAESKLAEDASKEQLQHYTNRNTISGFGFEVEEGYETRAGRERLEAKARMARRAAREGSDEPGPETAATARRAKRKATSRNATKAAKRAEAAAAEIEPAE